MTQEDKKKIRELIVVLQRIDNGDNVFFNIAQYKRLGLITETKKWGETATGNKIQRGVSFHLTDKARKYLNVII